MPLNLTLKPNEKLIVNGAVVSNNSPRAVTLTFHNKAQLLQQKDVLLPEEATTPLLRTYFALQCVYLDAEGADEHRRHFAEFAGELFTATSNADIRGAIAKAIAHVDAGEFYRALSALRSALPAERRLLHVEPS
jgi:flagellar biosynthesis repressor protein FlbT